MEQNKNGQLEKFIDLVKEIKTCMMITKDAAGKLNARPMNNAKVEDDGSVWFFTNEFSGKVAQISHENEIFLTYSAPGSNAYVAFNALAELDDDQGKIDEMWASDLNNWFPKGKQDPKILLIHAKPVDAEYWDHSPGKMMMLFNKITAAFTGNDAENTHATLEL